MQTSGKRGEKPGDFRSRLPECRLSWRSKECKRAESAAKSRGIFAVAPPSAACLGEAKSANERKARRKAGGFSQSPHRVPPRILRGNVGALLVTPGKRSPSPIRPAVSFAGAAAMRRPLCAVPALGVRGGAPTVPFTGRLSRFSGSPSCDFCQPTRKSCQPSRDFCQPACSRGRFSAVCRGTIADARMLPTLHGLGRNPGEDRLRLG